MTDSKEGINDDSAEQKEVESRRKFLKTSVAVGAAAAVLASGAHLVPTMTAAAKSMGISPEKNGSSVLNTKEPVIVSINGSRVDVYQGEAKFPIEDSSLAGEITSSVKRKI